MSDNIILYDSSCDFENFKKIIKEQSCTVISFDYNSHKLLLKNNIPHIISNDFINEEDISAIQNNSYNFTRWCDDECISNILMYEEINLGNLFYHEFRLLLVPLIKKFLECVKLFQKSPNAKYFSSSELYPFISLHTINVKILATKKETTTSVSSSMNYGFMFAGKHLNISLSKWSYNKIKSFSEFFLKYNFNSKIDTNKKNVLLLEFSPTRFKHFFLNIPKSDINVVLHNRRFPSVWNRDSFSILKNSQSIVTTSNGLMNSSMKKLINKNFDIFNSKIENLFNDDYFEHFFKFNNISFWSILKPILKNLFYNKLYDFITEIELTKKLFNTYNFSSILIMTEQNSNEQIAIRLAKKFDVKIALIQHGVYEDVFPETYEFNKTGVLPNLSDKFLVWGDILKKYSIECGIPDNKIEVIGNPAYDDFFKNSKKILSNNSFILLTTTAPMLDSIRDLTINSYLSREMAIEKICQTVKKLNKKLIIKLHPNPDDIDITDFVQKIDPTITIIKSGNVFDLLKDCEIFVTLDTSTTILEAQISHKPTMSLFVTDRKFGISEIFKSGSCLSVIDNNFEMNFKNLINDEKFRSNLIRCGDKFAHNYLANQGTASKKLILFLEKF